MARTKRNRRSYSAGEWGRNRVRVFPDPKTGLIQIEWREDGRRLSRSLGHRNWARAKQQADEFAAGFTSPEFHGEAPAEPEPLTLETLFDIYREEVTPTKAKRSRRYERAAMAMFLKFFGKHRKPGTLSQRGLGPVHPGASGGQGRPEWEGGFRPDDRIRPEVPARGPQLGSEIEGRGGQAPSGVQPAEGLEDAQAEEPG